MCQRIFDTCFQLANHPKMIAPVVAKVQAALWRLRFCTHHAGERFGVAVHEALVNAMCHGNLEMSSALRQVDERAYFELLQERRRQTPYRHRRVQVHFQVRADDARCTVRDEGKGFNPDTIPDPTDPVNLAMVGGRGLLLIRLFTDQVVHNDRGNEITLIQRRDVEHSEGVHDWQPGQ